MIMTRLIAKLIGGRAPFHRGRLRALPVDRRGNVAITFALSLLPVVCLVGAGIDYGRTQSAWADMQAVLDATALMMGKNSPASLTQSQLQSTATTYFGAQFNRPYAQNVKVTPSYSSTTGTLTLTASASVPTLFMQMAGVTTMPINASSQVTYSSIELAFVLDNTGSMVCGDSGYTTGTCTSGTSHITSLISAANSIVTTLFNTPSLTNLKVAIVPYVTTVNPGSKITQYVTMTDVAGNALYDPNGATPSYDNTESTQEWKGCVAESSSMVTNGFDTSEPSGGWTGPWDAYYWSSAGTNGNSSASTASPAKGYSGVADDNSWLNGNVGAHPTVSISYSHTGDLSTVCFPGSHGPNNGCPTAVTELTTNQTTISNAINALVPWCASGTAINVGMIWGWRALSPNPPFADGAPYGGATKVVVLETDGETELVPDCDNPNAFMDCTNDALGANFPTGPAINPETQVTGYGRVPNGLMGSKTSINTSLTTLRGRLATTCANMKAAGIIIFTIGFGPAATGGADAATLQACAGPLPGQYFSAPNAASLSTAFQNVATALGSLRLSK
jgi:Flp pilus assembly protein TadG